MSEYYKQNITKNDGFINLDQLQSKQIKEIELIEKSVSQLQEMMRNYMESVKILWNKKIVNFLESQDCMTLQYFTHDDYNKFIDFMMTQETFLLMKEAQIRLLKRKEYINFNM